MICPSPRMPRSWIGVEPVGEPDCIERYETSFAPAVTATRTTANNLRTAWSNSLPRQAIPDRGQVPLPLESAAHGDRPDVRSLRARTEAAADSPRDVLPDPLAGRIRIVRSAVDRGAVGRQR